MAVSRAKMTRGSKEDTFKQLRKQLKAKGGVMPFGELMLYNHKAAAREGKKLLPTLRNTAKERMNLFLSMFPELSKEKREKIAERFAKKTFVMTPPFPGLNKKVLVFDSMLAGGFAVLGLTAAPALFPLNLLAPSAYALAAARGQFKDAGEERKHTESKLGYVGIIRGRTGIRAFRTSNGVFSPITPSQITATINHEISHFAFTDPTIRKELGVREPRGAGEIIATSLEAISSSEMDNELKKKGMKPVILQDLNAGPITLPLERVKMLSEIPVKQRVNAKKEGYFFNKPVYHMSGYLKRRAGQNAVNELGRRIFMGENPLFAFNQLSEKYRLGVRAFHDPKTGLIAFRSKKAQL